MLVVYSSSSDDDEEVDNARELTASTGKGQAHTRIPEDRHDRSSNKRSRIDQKEPKARFVHIKQTKHTSCSLDDNDWFDHALSPLHTFSCHTLNLSDCPSLDVCYPCFQRRRTQRLKTSPFMMDACVPLNTRAETGQHMYIFHVGHTHTHSLMLFTQSDDYVNNLCQYTHINYSTADNAIS